MAIIYEVRLKDDVGNILWRFDWWRRHQHTHQINHAGIGELTLWGLDERRVDFLENYRLEFWRRDIEHGLAWYQEKCVMLRDEGRESTEAGDRVFSVFGVGPVDMLARRVIAYPASTAENPVPQSTKSGIGSEVMKAFVRENLGIDATLANGRLTDGVWAHLQIDELDGVGGSTWEGGRAGKPLLEVLQEIAIKTNVDFDIVPASALDPHFEIDPALGYEPYIFKTYPGQRGRDMSMQNMVVGDALNSDGHAPIVFSLAFDNMLIPAYGISRSGEATVVIVLGQGVGVDREYTVRKTAARIDANGYNIKEVVRQATSQNTTAAQREIIGDSLLLERVPKERFVFDVLQTPDLYYANPLAVDVTLSDSVYWQGDRVTAQFDGIERNFRIVGVRGTTKAPSDSDVAPPVETLRFTLAEVT